MASFLNYCWGEPISKILNYLCQKKIILEIPNCSPGSLGRWRYAFSDIFSSFHMAALPQ